MMAVRIKDELNDTWLVLEHVTHVRELTTKKASPYIVDKSEKWKNDETEVHVFLGGEYEILKGWTLDKWQGFIDQFSKRMQLMGGRPQ